MTLEYFSDNMIYIIARTFLHEYYKMFKYYNEITDGNRKKKFKLYINIVYNFGVVCIALTFL